MPTPDFDYMEFEEDERQEGGRRRRRSASEPEGDATGGLIPYKNPSALTAYYCGIFSVLPVLGFFLGLTGLILGIKGLRYAKEHPEAKGQVHAWIGIVMGGLFTIVWGSCLGIFVAAAIKEGW